VNDRSRPRPASVLDAAARSAERGAEEGGSAGHRRLERLGVGALATIVCTALWTAVLDDRAAPPAERPEAPISGAPHPRGGLEAVRPNGEGGARRDEQCPGDARVLAGAAEREWLPAHPPGKSPPERARKGRPTNLSSAPARAPTKRRASPLKPNPY
jgi:hypothetical protein